MSRKTNETVLHLVKEDKDFVRHLVQEALQQILEAEMDEHVGAQPYERTEARRTYRAGHYTRTLVTRVGPVELRVPQARDGSFCTEIFERYQRADKALVLAIMQMYLQGVATRRVKQVTEQLCGHQFSASTVSRLTQRLDEQLRAFAARRLAQPFPYLILDARSERMREDGLVRQRAVLVALGVDAQGKRHILGVELARGESRASWTAFVSGLVERGLHGVELVASDQHEGLRQAIMRVLPEAFWQRCYVHFLRNARAPAAHGLGRLPDRAALALRPARSERGARGSGGVAGQVGGHVPEAVRVGRGDDRGDAHVLPAAARAPQAHALDEPARALQPGDQAAHAPRAHLLQRGQLPEARARAERGAARGVAGRAALPEHGPAQRAQA